MSDRRPSLDDFGRHPSSVALSSALAKGNQALLNSRPQPSHATRPTSEYRGIHYRENSDSMMAVGDGDAPDRRLISDTSVPNARKVSVISNTQSVFRQLTTKSGLKNLRSRRRPGVGGYDSIDDAENDHIPIDLSSLGGLGFEMKGMSTHAAGPSSLDRVSTAYGGASAHESGYHQQSPKPSFQGFVQKHKKIGDGMIIGTELTVSSEAVSSRIPARAASKQNKLERSQTVKQIGQNLATKTQQIVAIEEEEAPLEEQFDLGFMLGPTMHETTSKEFGTMLNDNATRTKSYMFPEDPDVPNWKPFSMRASYILFLTCSALSLGTVQEVLCQLSLAQEKNYRGILTFDDVQDISVLDFFAWKYLPTIVTITFAVLFSIMDYDIRRLEPYYQLSQSKGARASASLNLDHITTFQYFVPFTAARLKQWAVVFSTIGNILSATVAPALQNPSIRLQANPNCPEPNDECPENQAHFWVRVDPNWSRCVTASYGIIATITVVLFFQLRRKSGLLSDPKGIAGVASMATKSHILQDFSGTDTATRAEIHEKLQHRRYLLYKSSIWQGEWTANAEISQESGRRLQSPHPIMLQLRAGIPLMLYIVFGLIMIPLFIAIPELSVVPNTQPWLPTLMATILKMFFSTFEADIRMIEPFYQLSKGNAAPQNSLTLDYQSPPYIWMPIKALIRKHFIVALVGFSSVFLDVLTMTVSSFSVNTAKLMHPSGPEKKPSEYDETWVSFWVSLALSMFILTFVLCTTALVYWRRRHPFLPREPSTIAAVMAFIYSSKMLEDFIDTEELTAEQMEKKLIETKKTYALGWFIGRDRRPHCAIDQEPLLSRYIHGKPYTDSISTGPLPDPYMP